MSLSLTSLQSIPVSYASCSIGYKDEHTLPKKLEAISAAGFQAIELSMPDLLSFASMHLREEVGPKDYDNLCAAARVVKSMCDAKGLKILVLQPFSNFEGWSEGSQERKDAFERAEGWIKIMEACGTDMLQVGSSDSPSEKIGSDRSRFASDLSQLGDMLAAHNFRLAYENWCWSSHASDWKDVLDIIQQVNKPNVGLCLDTFQTAGGEWADPTTSSGLIEDLPKEQLEKRFRESLEELARTVPQEKIFFLQISDAYRPRPQPLSKELGEDGTAPRGRWSHDYRPLPFDGGYLPVVEVTKAVLKTGFRGWFSYEVFDGGPEGKGKEYEMEDFAKEAMKCQKKLVEACAES